MIDLSVIILTKNEKLHIARCLERLLPLYSTFNSQLSTLPTGRVFVVDCHSTDGTQEIARAHGAEVVEHAWPGLYAKQFNWALDNLPIKTKWVLRLDADEYLYPETIEEVKEVLRLSRDSETTSLSLSRARIWRGKRIRHGGTAAILLTRFFRYGVGRCEERAMDEHIVTSFGRDLVLKGMFADDNLNDMDWWREKHRGYAKREAADALAFYRGDVRFKRSKELYYRQPPYLRAFIYFCIRYFLKLGFLDGRAGWTWNFWQGLWYRWIVDREISCLNRGVKNNGVRRRL